MANASKQIVTQSLVLNKHIFWHSLSYWHPRERYRMRTKAFAIARSLLLYCPHIPILDKQMCSFGVCLVYMYVALLEKYGNFKLKQVRKSKSLFIFRLLLRPSVNHFQARANFQKFFASCRTQHAVIGCTPLCRIYTFARVARRIARRMRVLIIYSPRHLLHYSCRHSSKRFFKHESKGTNGDLHYVYEHVNVRMHVKTHHLHRQRHTNVRASGEVRHEHECVNAVLENTQIRLRNFSQTFVFYSGTRFYLPTVNCLLLLVHYEKCLKFILSIFVSSAWILSQIIFFFNLFSKLFDCLRAQSHLCDQMSGGDQVRSVVTHES